MPLHSMISRAVSISAPTISHACSKRLMVTLHMNIWYWCGSTRQSTFSKRHGIQSSRLRSRLDIQMLLHFPLYFPTRSACHPKRFVKLRYNCSSHLKGEYNRQVLADIAPISHKQRGWKGFLSDPAVSFSSSFSCLNREKSRAAESRPADDMYEK